MVAGGALGEEVADLGERPVDADRFNDISVFGGDFEAGDELAAASVVPHIVGETLDLFQREHGHDTRERSER